MLSGLLWVKLFIWLFAMILYCFSCLFSFFFFFQAEDGIRDVAVTGVQTCALPISRRPRSAPCGRARLGSASPQTAPRAQRARPAAGGGRAEPPALRAFLPPGAEIGRASCRERV